MLQREKALNRNIDVSTLTLKNWVGLKNFEEHEQTQGSPNTHSDYYSDRRGEDPYSYRNRTARANIVTERKKSTSHYDNSEFTQDYKASHAHCLHQSFEALVQGLHTKIDTLQQSQIDIHHLDIITDRVFQNIEKLRNEIRGISAWVQETDSRNRILEEKVEILLMQNEIVTQKCSHLELLYERFFSTNGELNKDLHDSHRMHYEERTSYYVPNQLPSDHGNKPKTTSDLPGNTAADEAESYSEGKIFHSGNIYSEEEDENVLDNLYLHSSHAETDDDYNIEYLQQTKRNMEKQLKNNYPDDYKKIRKYDKKSFTSWLKKFWG